MNEKSLRDDVERELPRFADAVKSDTELVLMHQEAFSIEECLLLGKAIKYAGLFGKEVRIISNRPKPILSNTLTG